MKRIKLTQGKIAIVDDEDFDLLNNFKWNASKDRHTFYARTTENKKCIRMYRMIMKCPIDKQIDHINNNGLDNRKSNLRICTISENLKNRSKTINNSSGYKGVYWNKRYKKWVAYVRNNKKFFWIGRFSNKINAYKAYCNVAKKYHKDFFHG